MTISWHDFDWRGDWYRVISRFSRGWLMRYRLRFSALTGSIFLGGSQERRPRRSFTWLRDYRDSRLLPLRFSRGNDRIPVSISCLSLSASAMRSSPLLVARTSAA